MKEIWKITGNVIGGFCLLAGVITGFSTGELSAIQVTQLASQQCVWLIAGVLITLITR